jgi:serine/threonine-protein kinase RsbT
MPRPKKRMAIEVLNSETLTIAQSEDIVLARQIVRKTAVSLGFNLVDQTKIVTATSELARNTLDYGRGGAMTLQVVEEGRRTGIRLTFEDQGPGIPDLALALKDGYTTGGGMGLGLSGAKRLSDEFEIDTAPGKGTRVTILRWRSK